MTDLQAMKLALQTLKDDKASERAHTLATAILEMMCKPLTMKTTGRDDRGR